MRKPGKPPRIVEPELASPLGVAAEQASRDALEMVGQALRRKDVMLAFQPVVSARRMDQPAFYEGLIRILDGSGKIIPARDFIGAVEMTELGRMIDCLSLEMGLTALAQCPTLRLSINMSARSIAYPDWMRTLRQGLKACRTAGERLILEITEDSAIVMPDVVQIFMQDLRRHGVSFALDDFGAGMTSLRHLKQFLFDIVKIDGQFIRGIADSPDNQCMTKAILEFARHLDMFAVAESVESERDAKALTLLGIDCMQGYFCGAPTVTPPWKIPDKKGARRA